ncbi:MAG: HupE/UreJ family protein [Ferruginibacter sp.]
MKFNPASTYLVKVTIFLLITILVYCYLGTTGLMPGPYRRTAGFDDLFTAGFKSVFNYGFHFLLFVLALYAANPKFNFVIESAVVSAVIQTIFFALTFYRVISLNHFLTGILACLAVMAVLIDNLYVRKMKSARVGFVIIFSIIYGIWLGNTFLYTGFSPESNLELLAVINAGIVVAQLCIIALAFIFLGKLLANNKNYRKLVLIPLTAISFAVVALWGIKQII